MLAVGLMSGTSLDGVDAALVDICGTGLNTKVRLVAFETLPMPQATRGRVMACCHPGGGTSEEICSLNVELGHLFSEAVELVCKAANVDPGTLGYVASHGQTIWHCPAAGGGPQTGGASGPYSSTLQIGDPTVIAWDHGVRVISDFRSMDMAAGGQGAPLVPFSEMVLYRSGSESVGLLNIGGIGNVTVLPAGCGEDGIFAFDTGPGNMMVDEACRLLLGVPYDDGGSISATGSIDAGLLDELMANPYLAMEPPKSTGRELFGVQLVTQVLDGHAALAPADIVATLTAFTAASVADACKRFVEPRIGGTLGRLVVGGGGAHNATLVRGIAERLSGTRVLTQEDLGLSSDAKEAVAFAILGNQTLHELSSNVPSATGARMSVVLGRITPPPCGSGVKRGAIR